MLMFSPQDCFLSCLLLPTPWEAEEGSQRTQHETAAESA